MNWKAWSDTRSGREPPTHGRGGYVNYRCRCPVCTEAQRGYQRELRARLRLRVPPMHGVNGYVNYGCRCDVCSGDHSAYLRERREEKD